MLNAAYPLVFFMRNGPVYLFQAGSIMIVKLRRLQARMSARGQAEPWKNPASAGQKTTERSSGGDDKDDQSEQKNQRRHPPEVYAALQQLLFEGQLRLVLADGLVSAHCLQQLISENVLFPALTLFVYFSYLGQNSDSALVPCFRKCCAIKRFSRSNTRHKSGARI